MGKEAFRVIFVFITAGNGNEFLDDLALEQSVSGRSVLARIYYARLHSSRERGSNENANRIIRRFIPKGCDVGRYICATIQEIENWITR